MCAQDEERLKNEASFHDKKYSDSGIEPYHYKFNPTWPIFKAMIGKVGDVSGRRVLEFGCGTGWITAEIASLGAHVDAFDISSEAIEKTSRLLKSVNLQYNCKLRIMNGECLDYENDSFDIIFGFAILHHLDLSKVLPEIHRVLKPGGRAYFAEPLGSNPIINLYRRFTPGYRTSGERPLHFSDFKIFKNEFSRVGHEEYYFLALLSFLVIYIPFLRSKFDGISEKLMCFDKKILKTIPWVSRYSWYTVIELTK